MAHLMYHVSLFAKEYKLPLLGDNTIIVWTELLTKRSAITEKKSTIASFVTYRRIGTVSTPALDRQLGI